MSSWKATKLRNKIHVKHGFPFKSEFFQEAGDYVVLTPGNFHEEGGFKRNAEKDKCYSHSFPPEYLLKKGDLIVAMTEQAEGLLGSTAKIPWDNQFLHNQRLGLITAIDDEIDLDYIFHLFKTKSVRSQIRLSSSGSKVKHTSPERIYDVQVQPPPLSEQKKIAKVLATLDAKIELNKRINAELEAVAKLLYDYWFVQFDFPMTAEQAAALGQPQLEGQPYKSSGGKMVFNPTLKRELPDGWKASTLGGVFKLYQPQTISDKDFDNAGDYLVYGANGIIGRYNKYNHEKSQVALTCRGSTCGNLTRTLPFSWITGNAMVMAPKNEEWDVEFTHNLAARSGIHGIITGSGQPQITRSNLEGLKCVMPHTEMIQNYCATSSCITSQRITLTKQNQELTNLRDWLLPMLMNGQVTVK